MSITKIITLSLAGLLTLATTGVGIKYKLDLKKKIALEASKIEKVEDELSFIDYDNNKLKNVKKLMKKLNSTGTKLGYDKKKTKKFATNIVNFAKTILNYDDSNLNVELDELLIEYYNAKITNKNKNNLIKDIRSIVK